MEKRTYADRREYNIMAVSRRRRRLKEMAVTKLGGKCMFCGYNRSMAALDFHHIDEKTKSFELSTRGLTRSWKKISDELEKCVLVCSNCHREIHAGLIKVKDEAKDDKI